MKCGQADGLSNPRGKLHKLKRFPLYILFQGVLQKWPLFSWRPGVMSEVIVPLLKKGGQVEKKSALVLRLGGRGRAAGPAEGGGREKRRERCYRRRIGSSSEGGRAQGHGG